MAGKGYPFADPSRGAYPSTPSVSVRVPFPANPRGVDMHHTIMRRASDRARRTYFDEAKPPILFGYLWVACEFADLAGCVLLVRGAAGYRYAYMTPWIRTLTGLHKTTPRDLFVWLRQYRGLRVAFYPWPGGSVPYEQIDGLP